MYAGVNEIRNARQALHNFHELPRNRLRVASELALSAMLHSECWPRTMQSQANIVRTVILRYGPIHQTVVLMTEEETDQCESMLAKFVEAFDTEECEDHRLAVDQPALVSETQA